MKSLLSKNLSQFLIYTIVILLCCVPLFYVFLKFFYTKDLDELIIFRSIAFEEEKLPRFTIREIDEWNYYNEDIQLLSYDDSYPLDRTIEEFLFNKAEGHPIYYRIIYKKVSIENQSYILMSRIPMIEDKDLFRNLFAQYGLIFVILLISLIIVQQIFSRKSWGPFYRSLELIENYSLEKGTIPEFGETDIAEFHRLNEILTILISNNLRVYKQQKEFIENASHELQTPIAVFQSQLDVLLQDPDLTEKQVTIIQSLYSVSSRLSRLNKNLLLLAKIDNAQFKEIEELDFVDVFNSLFTLLKEMAENSGIRVKVDVKNSLFVKANKILLESLISNLVVNAIRHNKENGYIHIVIENDRFIVSNMGEERSLDETKVFRRFSRVSEEKKGNGLGLSIVSQICKFHGWGLSYVFQENLHCFYIRFL